MSDDLAMKWALICSVPDEGLVPELVDFAKWLMLKLEEGKSKIGVTHSFEESPEVVVYLKPCSVKEDFSHFFGAYENINEEHPGVLFVLHILPCPGSMEYTWMKSLSQRFVLIRQGVLLENALNRFANLDLDEVVGNIHQWIYRRMTRIIASREKSDRMFELIVGDGDDLQEASFNPNIVVAAVQTVLHGSCSEESDSMISSVRVAGYPSSFNQYELANLFSKFRINSVFMQTDFAIIDFANKYYAAQAAVLLDKSELDSTHTLSVIPVHPVVRKQVRTDVA